MCRLLGCPLQAAWHVYSIFYKTYKLDQTRMYQALSSQKTMRDHKRTLGGCLFVTLFVLVGWLV